MKRLLTANILGELKWGSQAAYSVARGKTVKLYIGLNKFRKQGSKIIRGIKHV